MPRIRKADSGTQKTEIRWSLGAYIRLSREDNIKSDNDSNSVKNQRAILTEYYQNHVYEFDSVEYYVEACDIIEPTQETACIKGFRELVLFCLTQKSKIGADSVSVMNRR